MSKVISVLILVSLSTSNALAGSTIPLIVLPFANLGGQTNMVHWQYTIPLLLKSQIGCKRKVFLMPDDSVEFGSDAAVQFAYQEVGSHSRSSIDLLCRMGRAVEARKVIWGSYEVEEGLWKLHARIVDVPAGSVCEELSASGSNCTDVISNIGSTVLSQLGVATARNVPIPAELSNCDTVIDSLGKALYDKNSGVALDQVEDSLRRAASKSPRCALAQEALACVLITQEKLDEANVAAESAVKLAPQSVRSHYLLGLSYLLQGLNTLASEQFLEARRIEPSDPVNLLKLGELYALEGKLNEALLVLQEAKRLGPYLPLIHEELARIYTKQDSREKALSELRLAERYDTGSDAQVLFAMAQTYDFLHDGAKAADLYEKFLAAAREIGLHSTLVRQAEASLKDVRLRLKPQFVKASKPSLQGRDAQNELRTKLRQGDRQYVDDPFTSTPEMARWAASVCGKSGSESDKALKLFNVLLPHCSATSTASQLTAKEAFKALFDPRASLSCEDYAFLFIALARDAGLRAFYVLVDRDYRNTCVSHACAVVFLAGGPLLVDPGYSWFGVPHLQFRILNDVQATAVYLAQSQDVVKERIAVRLAPDIPLVHFNLALSLAQAGQLPEAKAALTKGLQLDPQSWMAEFTEGTVEFLEGRAEDAIEHLLRASSDEPDFPLLHRVIAKAYDSLGKLEKARTEYRASVETTDNRETADADRERILAIDQQLDSSQKAEDATHEDRSRIPQQEPQNKLKTSSKAGTLR